LPQARDIRAAAQRRDAFAGGAGGFALHADDDENRREGAQFGGFSTASRARHCSSGRGRISFIERMLL
jgi:hypothetical protein